MHSTLKKLKSIHWLNLMVLTAIHLIAVGGVFYTINVQFSWWSVMLAAMWWWCANLAISGGYHRLFAHRAYRCSGALRIFYLLFGAASVQNSALCWASDHRRHHQHTDHESDPYNIQQGIWWAHVGWLLFKGENDYSNSTDLLSDPLIRLQHTFYVPLAILMAVALPFTLGLLWGDPLGALLWCGFIRLVLQYHATFSINSLCHWHGRQPYSLANSSRDSFLAAIITMGEGYHNFHHRFPFDYRNGVRLFDFDPTKWFLWLSSKVGLAWDLRRASKIHIASARNRVTESLASAHHSRQHRDVEA